MASLVLNRGGTLLDRLTIASSRAGRWSDPLLEKARLLNCWRQLHWCLMANRFVDPVNPVPAPEDLSSWFRLLHTRGLVC